MIKATARSAPDREREIRFFLIYNLILKSQFSIVQWSPHIYYLSANQNLMYSYQATFNTDP